MSRSLSHPSSMFERSCARAQAATVRDVEPRRAVAEAGAWRDVFAQALGPRPRRVLDVGSGLGDAAFALWDLGHYPQGVDSSPEQVHRARSRARFRCAAVPFQVGDAEDLDFHAGAFDAVVARDVLGGLPHPAWALAEWFRVLKPGGIVVVAETAPPARGRVRAADYLRFTGFADVESREVPTSRATPWFRRWTSPSAHGGAAAWGTRP